MQRRAASARLVRAAVVADRALSEWAENLLKQAEHCDWPRQFFGLSGQRQ